MIMKKSVLLSVLLVLGMLPLLFACSSDDDNSAAELTSDEIVQLLTGKWEINGELKIKNQGTGDSFEGSYNGTIEFKKDNKIDFRVTKGDKYTVELGGKTYSMYLEEDIIDDYYGYSILKKNGKNYIAFGSKSHPYNFEIVSLKASVLRLVLNQSDVYNDNNTIDYYMTLFSN